MKLALPAETPFPATAADARETRARELGAFLRTRREGIDPARLGLPWIGTRRTPGLRREEVAQLAGIGITWYTKLEQGRPVQCSVRVLSAIAEALQCSKAETSHLFTLAGLGTPPAARPTVCEHLASSARVILDQLDPLPAFIQNTRFQIVGFNRNYCRLTGIDLASVPEAERNCVSLAFTNPRWRACLADWPELMPRMVAMFRAAMAENARDPYWENMLRGLLDRSAEFRDIWQRNEVQGVENQLKRFLNPQVGLLRLQQTNWWSAPKNGDRLIVYVPADADSEQALKTLATLPMPS